jgi:uncharacterized membrane protein YeaQ/YmgE (transglycosylase-associated protein family)
MPIAAQLIVWIIIGLIGGSLAGLLAKDTRIDNRYGLGGERGLMV